MYLLLGDTCMYSYRYDLVPHGSILVTHSAPAPAPGASASALAFAFAFALGRRLRLADELEAHVLGGGGLDAVVQLLVDEVGLVGRLVAQRVPCV